MSYEKLKYLSLNAETGVVILTTAPSNVSPTRYERYFYRPTMPQAFFDIKIGDICEQIIDGNLQPLKSCNHQDYFRIMKKAMAEVDLDLLNNDFIFHTETYEQMKKYVIKNIAVPYILGQKVNIEEKHSYIREVLRPEFLNQYKSAEETAKRNGEIFVRSASRIKAIPDYVVVETHRGETYVSKSENYNNRGTLFNKDHSAILVKGADSFRNIAYCIDRSLLEYAYPQLKACK